MEEPGKTRKVPTEKKQEDWQEGGSHWYRTAFCVLMQCLMGTTKVDVELELRYSGRRASTGGSIDNFEDGRVEGWKQIVVAAGSS
jgi:hypothetical protein